MATKQQIPVVAARLTEFQDEFSSLSVEDAQWVIMNAKEAILLFVSAVAKRNAIIATFTVSATKQKFVAKDKFRVDTEKYAKIKISFLDNDFKGWFLGKIEDPFAGSTVYVRKVEKNSVNSPILAELGGNDAAEITLTEMYSAMATYPDGKSDNMFDNGWLNIFYIKDINGTLRAVHVHWSNYGWDVVAYSVEHPIETNADYRVFSRNSAITQTN